jgi:hypothetical protein
MFSVQQLADALCCTFTERLSIQRVAGLGILGALESRVEVISQEAAVSSRGPKRTDDSTISPTPKRRFVDSKESACRSQRDPSSLLLRVFNCFHHIYSKICGNLKNLFPNWL